MFAIFVGTYTNVRIGIVNTCGHVSVFARLFVHRSVASACLSVCPMIVYHCARCFIFRPSICLIFCPSVCVSVCMYVHMYLCRDEHTSDRKLN